MFDKFSFEKYAFNLMYLKDIHIKIKLRSHDISYIYTHTHDHLLFFHLCQSCVYCFNDCNYCINSFNYYLYY